MVLLAQEMHAHNLGHEHLRGYLAAALAEAGIGTRMLFGGNLLRQPAFVELRQQRPEAVRVPVATEGADALMNQALFLGTYLGLSEVMIEHECAVIAAALTTVRR